MFILSLRVSLKGRFTDNGIAVLFALYEILQANGAALTDGWLSIIQILDDVIDQDVAEFVPLGFKIVQLIVDDFLGTRLLSAPWRGGLTIGIIDGFPRSSFPNLIHTIGLYGRQRLAANISFTSIGLLWQVTFVELSTATNLKGPTIRYQII